MSGAGAVRGEVIFPGSGEGRVLRLGGPISFWGGVDPASGRITDPRHPDHDASIAGRVLAMSGTIGSSGSSSVMLELMRAGKGPAALVLGKVDAILVLGVIVAGEMGWPTIPVVRLEPADLDTLPAGRPVRVAIDGMVSWTGDPVQDRPGNRAGE